MLIELKNVSKFYYSSNVVSAGFTNVSCNLDIGEFVVITGQSGSGKSTLLNVISGLDNYQEGEMFVNGEDTSGYSDTEIEEYRKKYVSNIFQNFNLISSYSVYKNIALNLIVQGKKGYKEKVNEAIKKVGLWKYRNTKASKLSGGQKQRVAIARALVRDTPIIIADEPTGDLDEENAKEILKLFKEISKDKLVIIVTHNYAQVEQYATRKLQMSDGHIIEDVELKPHQQVNNYFVKQMTKMRFASIFELAFINTFNIVAKFLLLLIVFLFLTVSVIGLYSTYKVTQSESSFAYSYYFEDDDHNRFIIKNKDESALNARQINELKNAEHVVKVEENDLFVDNSIYLTNNVSKWLSGNINSIKEISSVDIGRLPTKDNEIVIAYSPEDDWILDSNDLINYTYHCYIDSRYSYSKEYDDFVIVGAVKDKSISYYKYKMYFTDGGIEQLRYRLEKSMSKITLQYINKNTDLSFVEVIVNDKVKKGEIYIGEYIDEYLRSLNNNKSVLKHLISFKNKALYYTCTLDLPITKVVTEKVCKLELGINYNDLNKECIIINSEDYQKLFDCSNFQVSIFIDETRNAQEVKDFLEANDYDYIFVYDTVSSENDFDVIEELFIGATILCGVVGLFFISYFIIRIILKSRNTYFATIRMLGATKKNVKMLIITELVIIMNISYLLVLVAIVVMNLNKTLMTSLGLEGLIEVVSYYGIIDYVILYIILVTLSILIGRKYANKLYSSSAISIYKDGD